MVPSSTIITVWAPDALNYIWDVIVGFLYSANGDLFIVVFLIVIATICIVVAGVKLVLSGGRSRRSTIPH